MEPTGLDFSSPPDEPDQAQKTPSEGLKKRLETVKTGILGEPGKSVQLDEYRGTVFAGELLLPSDYDEVIDVVQGCRNSQSRLHRHVASTL
jgi:hypothetical protein